MVRRIREEIIEDDAPVLVERRVTRTSNFAPNPAAIMFAVVLAIVLLVLLVGAL
jgi:uncharacterized membrane protein